MRVRTFSTIGVILLVAGSIPALAAPEDADLTTWVAETYAGSDANSGPGNWVVSADGTSVVELANGSPTLFVSDHESAGYRITTTFSPPGVDDDFVGVALGFSPGESARTDAYYLLIDWKRSDQTVSWDGVPTAATAGLAVSRVAGIPLHTEFWGRYDLSTSPGSITELARGATLGATGWTPNASHVLVLEYRPTNLTVWVDGVEQINLDGDFPSGPFAVYDFSQPSASFSEITFERLNEPPTIGGGGAPDVTAPEGSDAVNNGSFEDPDGDDLTLTCDGPCDGFIDLGDGTWTWTLPIVDDLATTTVAITADDGSATVTDEFTVTGTNVDPVIQSVSGPTGMVGEGTPVALTGTLSDAGLLDTHSGTIDWGDGTSSDLTVDQSAGSAGFSGSHAYASAGSYTITVTVTDDDGGSDTASIAVEIFDPDDFVTGGGWVTSPEGALAGNPDHTGKATFGFVVRYRGTGVTGNLTLQIHKEAMVKATGFDSLTIVDGVATFAGTATIDGEGAFTFEVVAVDERLAGTDADTFWIEIRDGTGIVYGGPAYPADGLPTKGRGIQVHDR